VRIALVDTSPKQAVYPVALLKLGAWRKAEGDTCKLFHKRLPKAGEYDAIWLTGIFTFDLPHALGIAVEAKNRAAEVMVGGVSPTILPEPFEARDISVWRGLHPEAEKHTPDYALLPEPPRYSITHASRGCVRKCKFCMVSKVEPEFVSRDWESDIAPSSDRILFFDNNWLAKELDDLSADVAIMRRLGRQGRLKAVDFNQGLDCRLLTEDHVQLLEGIPFSPLRFAFDGMQEDGYCQRAIERMAARGHKDFNVYVLYNFKDSPEDFYYRLRECARLTESLGVSVQAFPMRYQPIMEVDPGRAYVGEKWTSRQRKGFMSLLGHQSLGGQISAHNLAEFEYWFGKTAEEFAALLSYPKIRKLALRRQGSRRLERWGLAV